METKLQISQRGIEMPESPIRKLAPLAEEAQDRGMHIFRLNIGQPDLPTPQKALDVLKHIDRTTLEYSPSQGIRSFREALVGYYERYQIKLHPDEIIITSGGSEAVLFAFMSCLNPGDEIIIPEPAYANYMSFAISAGAVIRTVATTIDEGFCLPKVEKFEELINERTKAILICNPNNPTGYLYTQREMNQIRDLVKKYNLYLFSDEVYREFIYTGSPYISAMHLDGIQQNVVLIDSVSKRYSECGTRIGALITKNEAVRKTVMKFCQARLSVATLDQVASAALYTVEPEYFDAVRLEYQRRRDTVMEKLRQIPGVVCEEPHGAFYLMAALPIDDADKFQQWLLTDFEDHGETVMFAPGHSFYATAGKGVNEIRIAYVLKQEDLARAMDLLALGIEAYNRRS